jgi:SAM-dependent methyltransferase
VPPTEAIPLTTLASLTSTNEITLQRVLRHCIINHLFAEPTKGYIAHTPTSLLLLTNPASIAWASMMPDDYWPITTHAVDAIEKWPESSEPTETAVTLKHGVDSFYQWLGKNPAKAQRFGMAMTGFSSGPGLEFESLATHYPWQVLPKDGVVVDVGSGIGFVSVAIAQLHPHLNFVCQDLPSTVAAAPEQVPAEVKDRITFQGHDFLTPNPVKDADVYFFRFVFHNWSDPYCVRILQALIPALKPGARILINDTALPERGEMSRWEERTLRDLDMTMLTLLNAREREIAEFKKLFEVADKRFKWVGASQPPKSKMWKIEAVWDPEIV